MLRKLVFFAVVVQAIISTNAAPPKGSKLAKAEANIRNKLKSASPAQIKQYKEVAAKRMSMDLAKVMTAISKGKGVPAQVKQQAKAVADMAKNGKLELSLATALPGILQQGSQQAGKPINQVQTALAQVVPYAPSDLKSPLQGVLGFLGSNLGGVNNIVKNVVQGDVLSGTVRSLTTSLGATAEAVNGSVASLGQLLGSLLSGLQ